MCHFSLGVLYGKLQKYKVLTYVGFHFLFMLMLAGRRRIFA